ncbi:protein of unknown function [Methanocaldococcus lauensis]|nr:protein of unknown function [Methanocaldococcus lauensis]
MFRIRYLDYYIIVYYYVVLFKFDNNIYYFNDNFKNIFIMFKEYKNMHIPIKM